MKDKTNTMSQLNNITFNEFLKAHSEKINTSLKIHAFQKMMSGGIKTFGVIQKRKRNNR